jgi:pimeloyl-ACP methyl ester carboxylesterase
MALAISSGGSGSALLVVLHGLGATRQVWASFLARADERWGGRWLAIDLPGHGDSSPSADYRPHEQARLIGAAVQRARATGPLIVLGHSLGGVIGMALASGAYSVQPQLVAGLGVKVAWSSAEVAALAARAQTPAKAFAQKSDAIESFLKSAGLLGLAAACSPLAKSGVAREPTGGWRLAMDPMAFGLGDLPIADLVANVRCPLHLAAGAADRIASLADLQHFDPDAVILPGLGHNAMIDDPDAVWGWLNGLLESKRRVGPS